MVFGQKKGPARWWADGPKLPLIGGTGDTGGYGFAACSAARYVVPLLRMDVENPPEERRKIQF
jgi:hypothetical protein